MAGHVVLRLAITDEAKQERMYALVWAVISQIPTDTRSCPLWNDQLLHRILNYCGDRYLVLEENDASSDINSFSGSSSEELLRLQRDAQQGNSRAQLELGACYKNGTNTSVNISEAFSWYMQAAELGEAQAQFEAAMMYELGLGTAKSGKAAALWYRRAAAAFHIDAFFALGSMHKVGRSVAKDPLQAYCYYYMAYQFSRSIEAMKEIQMLETHHPWVQSEFSILKGNFDRNDLR